MVLNQIFCKTLLTQKKKRKPQPETHLLPAIFVNAYLENKMQQQEKS